MSSDLWFANLAAWWLQTGVITVLAAVLLRTMPVRSPRTVLAYLQGLLCVCLSLPALEPWRSASVTAGISTGAVSAMPIPTSSSVPMSASHVLALVLAVGIAVRLVWLALGCMRLRRYRREAWPLDTEIASLQETLGTRAQVYLSRAVSGPVTFGFGRPTVLVPARWRDLDSASRTAIAYHELLHVRRNDWVFQIAEEVIRALLWFHPAIWWLTTEIRLAREQVVDRMVVSFTGAAKPYAQILLAFAGIDSAVTAPAFTQKRHLTRRIKFLLEEVSMTKSRLLVSLGGITLCLVVAGAVAVWAFPMQSVTSTFIVQDDSAPTNGVIQGVIGGVIEGVPGGAAGGVGGGVVGGVGGGVGSVGGVPGLQAGAAGSQNPKVFKVGDNGVTAPQVVYKVDPKYTKQARKAKIQGTVVLHTEIHPDGHAHNTHVVHSLDPGLDHNAIEAVSQWKFAPGKKDGKPVAVAATIEVNYRLN